MPAPGAFPYHVVVITGATGSLGTALTLHLLRTYPHVVVRCLARNEHRMAQLQAQLWPWHERISCFLGDVRDQACLELAFRGAELVIHAAALKQIDRGEYDPMEFIETNVNGTKTVIRAALTQEVRQVITISTDKAVAPANLYGATKMVAERLTIQANSYSGRTRYNAVRYGNVFGSNGSVIERYHQCLRDKQPLPITSYEMTRFFITLQEAVELICFTASQVGLRGGIVVPLLPAYRQIDLVAALLNKQPEAIDRARDTTVIGIRPGEKLAETLLTADEIRRAALWLYRSPAQENGTASPIGKSVLIQPEIHHWTRQQVLPIGWHEPESWPYGPYQSDIWPWLLTSKDLAMHLQETAAHDAPIPHR